MRMRTVEQAFEFFKEQDPGTALTKTGLYRLVRSGKIPHVACGKKKLIALESVEAFIAGEPLQSSDPVTEKPKLYCSK